MNVTLKDNRILIENKLKVNITRFLYEVGGEFVAGVVRRSRTDTFETRNSYTYQVANYPDHAEVTVGSPKENAIWEEFGTGEFALKGNGRKGGWKYYDEDDDRWYFTWGKKPNEPMTRTWNALKSKIRKRLKEVIQGSLGG